MPAGRKFLYAVSLLCCWLVLGAGADDLCLLRFALPSPPPDSAGLPPADPNANAVVPSHAWVTLPSHRNAGDDLGPAGSGPGMAHSLPATHSSPADLARGDSGPSSAAGVNRPLRC
jgi:hypothetical protein